MTSALRCAVLGSGNIGADLMMKLQRSSLLEHVVMVGIDPASEGLARARDLGIDATSDGIDWIEQHRDDIDLVFEATSAYVHRENAPRLAAAGLTAIDLTPAAIGPLVVPAVNIDSHLDEPNVNLITCGGQATVPIVGAVSAVCPVPYAEIVSTVASLSAGPGTRKNIDEFTKTTANALEVVGGASHGKAIMILNPAEPAIFMRNTVFCGLPDGADVDAVCASIVAMVDTVARYVPGYRLKSDPVIDTGPFPTPGGVVPHRVVALLEVEGAGDWFPPYAGNLDIMTAAAVRVAEAFAAGRAENQVDTAGAAEQVR